MPSRIFPLFYHNTYHTPSSSTSSLETLPAAPDTKRRPSYESQRTVQMFPFSGSSRAIKQQQQQQCSSSPATLTMTIESPPLVSYGQPKDSTGALLSGLLHLDVHELDLGIKSLNVVLVAEIVTRRPIATHCPECTTRSEVLRKWSIISDKRLLGHGMNSYPFSYHIPGSLPASNTNALGKIRYVLVATATTTEGDEIKLQREITISRSILPGAGRHSLRIFPPTNLSANVELPNVVHPAGDFPISIRLDGVTCPDKETRWRLRKANWRIDEHSKIISAACPNHSSKVGGDGKGILHEDIRVVGTGEMKTGWKSNYDKTGGQIELEFLARLPAHMDATCDVDAECGVKVNHNLVLELVVAEEHSPGNSSKSATPTGAARVLRMQFSLVVTARGGLGISWDEEQPPLYENVPPAPPTYNQTSLGSPHPDLYPPPVYCEGIPPPS